MSTPALIGPTDFEDSNGKLCMQGDWQYPLALRPLEVILGAGVFAAQRQHPDGRWVYRLTRHRAAGEGVDPYVKNLVDVAPPPKPALTVKDVHWMLEGLVNAGSKQKGTVNVKLLRPVVEMLKQLETAE